MGCRWYSPAAAAAFCFRLLTSHQKAAAPRKTTGTPPTTPPAIAPVLFEDFPSPSLPSLGVVSVADGASDELGTLVLVGESDMMEVEDTAVEVGATPMVVRTEGVPVIMPREMVSH